MLAWWSLWLITVILHGWLAAKSWCLFSRTSGARPRLGSSDKCPQPLVIVSFPTHCPGYYTDNCGLRREEGRYEVLYDVCVSRYLGLGHTPASPAWPGGTLPVISTSLPRSNWGHEWKYSGLRGQTARKQNKSRLVNKITWYFTEDKFMGYLSCVVLTTLSPSH